MNKTIQLLLDQLVGINRSNISAALVQTIRVDYHGQPTALQYLAMVQDGPKRVSIIPYDPSTSGTILQALTKSGLNGYQFSKREIVVNVPDLTCDEINKTHARIKHLGEEAKVAIRNIRKKLRRGNDGLSEDEKNSLH